MVVLTKSTRRIWRWLSANYSKTILFVVVVYSLVASFKLKQLHHSTQLFMPHWFPSSIPNSLRLENWSSNDLSHHFVEHTNEMTKQLVSPAVDSSRISSIRMSYVSISFWLRSRFIRHCFSFPFSYMKFPLYRCSFSSWKIRRMIVSSWPLDFSKNVAKNYLKLVHVDWTRSFQHYEIFFMNHHWTNEHNTWSKCCLLFEKINSKRIQPFQLVSI